ncbi:MAG: tRNA pseudouridine(13) synthase TruD [Nanoarchaeota archaeon]
MYQIKRTPEEFIVKEISKINTKENGQYAYFLLKKTNYSTVRALEVLSEKLKIPLKNIGFAGNKDRNAVTEQAISVFKGSRNIENLNLRNIKLKYLGNGKEPISLGDLEGNEFTIVMWNLSDNEVKKIKNLEKKTINVPNLFGPQRFSNNNHLVGKAVIKKDFKKAVELILENEGGIELQIKEYLKNNKNDYAGALRLIPLKTRKLFIHSYQSLLFNRTIDEYLKNNKEEKKIKNIQVPIIGFNLELNSIKNKELKNIIKKIVEEEKISPRDFIISQMPELTSEGTSRNLFFELNDLKVLETSEDGLNESMKKIKINFTLPKSCYATTLLEFICQ